MSVVRLVLLSCVMLALWSGCTPGEKPSKTSPQKIGNITPQNAPKGEKIRIALGGMITPKEGMAYYRELLQYLGAEIGRPVEFVDSEDYAEINRKLQNGEVDAAFVCSGPYVTGKRTFGLEFIAAPQAYGKAVYYSYFIVPRDSPARQLSDLKGKTFAFADPLSNSGKVVPEYTLSRMKTSSATFFGKTFYSGSHDESIKAVSEGLVDGAAVDSLIWDYQSRKHPEKTANTRIIYQSAPYAPPPFVVRPGLDPALKEKIRTVLLNVHASPKGKAILDKMLIDRFVALDDKAYDSVRDITRWVEKSRIKAP